MKMFGTDGIRDFPYKNFLKEESLIKIGYSFSFFLKRNYKNTKNIFIAQDTRKSSNYIAKNLIKGINLCGLNTITLGVLPTSSLSIFINKYPYSSGIMITASHNDHSYNGLKFFNESGEKISTNDEEQIEKTFNMKVKLSKAKVTNLKYENADKEYINEIIKRFNSLKLRKFNIGIDLANGSSYKVTKKILRAFGVGFKAISDKPNGLNINKNCGVENLNRISKFVVKKKLDFGIAIDGDADRIVIIGNKGEIIHGDKIMSYIASNRLKAKSSFVTTIMGNTALDSELSKKDIKVIRTDVGDKNVYYKMKEINSNFGGENSGHYIFRNLLNTSDSNLSLIYILGLLTERKSKINAISKITLNPSVLKSFIVHKKKPINKIKEIQNFITDFNCKFHSNSYLNIRYSGTENKIRILIQDENLKRINAQIKIFEGIIEGLNDKA